MTKHIYTEIQAAHLTGQEITLYSIKDEEQNILDERYKEEIINEDGEIPTLWSKCFHQFQ